MESLNFEMPITKTRFCVYVLLAVLWCVYMIFLVNSWPLAAYLFNFDDGEIARAAFEKFLGWGIPLIYLVFAGGIAIYYVFRGLLWFVVSPGFCLFYLLNFPIEAIFVFMYLMLVALHSRKHHTWLVDWLILSLIPYGYGLYVTGNGLIILLILPFFHLISRRPEVILGSRFVSGDMLVTPLKSSFEKSKMAEFKASDWWLYVEPYVKHLPSIIFYNGEVQNSDKTVKETQLTSDIKGMKIDYDLVESKILTLIERDNNFNATEFMQRTKKIFYLLQSSISNQNLRHIEHLVSDALYEQLSVKVAEQKSKGIYYRNQELSVKSIEISNVDFDQNYDEITVLISYQTQDAVYDIKTKALLDKAPEPITVLEYWILIRKSSAVSAKGGGLSDSVCPNCGAEVKIGQATVCGACRSYLRNGAFDWVLTRIVQSYEWVNSNPDFVDGWNKLKELDPNFNIYNIEDICGVLFWQLRLAEKHGNPEYISRFAFPEYKEKIKAILTDTSIAQKINREGIVLGGINLQAIEFEADRVRLYVQLVWSGIPYLIDKRGKILPGSRINKCMREIYVISRPIGEQTNLDNTLSSLHCPKCGGQLKRDIVGNCEYCGFDLNDAKSWRLERIIASGEEAYRKVTEKQADKIAKQYSEYYVKNSDRRKDIVKVERMASGKEIVSAMAKILYADGVADEAEVRLLRKTAESYMLPETDLSEIVEAARDGSLEVPISDNKPLSVAIFQGMAEMAFADGVISLEEDAVLQDMAEKLNYDKYTFNMFIKKAENKSARARRQGA
ncbi:MAG: TIM44-like domain-containing protein [Candidatus Riflebacteria bacterium]|nr:TIM44-like domain-containing protein [Candidatus Riflebacteria bacterium]